MERNDVRRVVTASADEHSYLVHGLRGGGGDLGVVTEFELRLHSVGPVVFGGMPMHPRDRAPEVCRFFRGLVVQAPRPGNVFRMNQNVKLSGRASPPVPSQRRAPAADPFEADDHSTS